MQGLVFGAVSTDSVEFSRLRLIIRSIFHFSIKIPHENQMVPAVPLMLRLIFVF